MPRCCGRHRAAVAGLQAVNSLRNNGPELLVQASMRLLSPQRRRYSTLIQRRERPAFSRTSARTLV